MDVIKRLEAAKAYSNQVNQRNKKFIQYQNTSKRASNKKGDRDLSNSGNKTSQYQSQSLSDTETMHMNKVVISF